MKTTKYSNVNHWFEQELLGCTRTGKDNSGMIIHKLVSLIGLFKNPELAENLRVKLIEEGHGSGIDYLEYAINELQREYRIAKAWGNPDMKREEQLTDKWISKIIRKKGEDAALDLFNILKANRERRIQ